MDITKTQICDLLRAWINQRPGLDFANYGDVSAYRSELRKITKTRAEALQLLRAVELRDSITADALIAAFQRAYSGRLTLTESKGRPALDYCTGQYWPTEYRAAATAVLASALWDQARADMPAPCGKVKRTSGVGQFAHESEHDSINGKTPGEYLRGKFRREFGRGIQARWFD